MKKFFLFIIVVLIIQTNVIGQISLINTYNSAVYVANIEGEGHKYFGIDFETSQVKMYGTDHVLWKTIDIEVPVNSVIDEVAYVSSKLFNSDNNIELLVVFNEYIVTSDTSGFFIYSTKIINENGVMFLDVPGGGYSVIYKTDEDIANLLLYVYDFSVNPFLVSTEVYSIPGVPYYVNEVGMGVKLQNAFPNPTRSYITIPFTINNNVVNAEIVIYNELGAEVYRNQISQASNNFKLNTKQFSKGSYFYSIIADGFKSPAKKIIIQ